MDENVHFYMNTKKTITTEYTCILHVNYLQ